ncbi:MAG: glycosyltransferase family 4 protein [Patescibacteria group bacterium]|jgi:glycosyltransferase involved in cell wall biosynthesis
MAKKILIFSTAYLPLIGGAEIAIKEITDQISDIQFDMITLRFNSSLPKFERIGNINVYRIGFAKLNPGMDELVKFPLKFNKLFFPFSAYFKACRLHKKNHYDGIWAMMAAYAGFAAMFFKTCYKNVPYLLTLQEGDPIPEIKKKIRFLYPLFKRIFIQANIIQAISNYLANFAREMGYKGRLEVVPNGVNAEKFKIENLNKKELKNKFNINESDKILVTISRLVKKNAIDDIIKSLVYLPENIKFLILGDGPDKKFLENLVKELKLENRVILKGQISQDDLPKYLAVADIFIRPSLSEGQGIAFLEAMAAGVPVIATPVGGIVDFLRDKETGLFCEVNNPKSIAEKAKILLENKDLVEKIKINAVKLVREYYDWHMIALKIKNIFLSLK